MGGGAQRRGWNTSEDHRAYLAACGHVRKVWQCHQVSICAGSAGPRHLKGLPVLCGVQGRPARAHLGSARLR